MNFTMTEIIVGAVLLIVAGVLFWGFLSLGWSIIKFLVLIGILVGAYHYLQPYYDEWKRKK